MLNRQQIVSFMLRAVYLNGLLQHSDLLISLSISIFVNVCQVLS